MQYTVAAMVTTNSADGDKLLFFYNGEIDFGYGFSKSGTSYGSCQWSGPH